MGKENYKMNVDKFIIDVETTGIIPQDGKLLSVGIIAIDDQLNAVDDFEINIHADAESLELLCDKYVKQMLHKSGLWNSCIKSEITLEEAELKVLEFLQANIKKTKKLSLLINNTPAFDMEWLKCYMPKVAALFGYRMLNISTLNILAREFRPELAARVRSNKTYTHLALDDCYESLGELRLYVDKIFKK